MAGIRRRATWGEQDFRNERIGVEESESSVFGSLEIIPLWSDVENGWSNMTTNLGIYRISGAGFVESLPFVVIFRGHQADDAQKGITSPETMPFL